MYQTKSYGQTKNYRSFNRPSLFPIKNSLNGVWTNKVRNNLSAVQDQTSTDFYRTNLPPRLPKISIATTTKQSIAYQKLLDERNLWPKKYKDVNKTFYEIRVPLQQDSMQRIKEPQEVQKKTFIDKRQSKHSCEYEFGECIGKGAYARVKEAIHIRFNKPVAIKIYDKELFEEARRKKRVMLEVEIMKMLHHKNIVKYYDRFQTSKHLYLVMELVKGCSLREYIKSQPNKKVKESKALKIFKDIALAVNYCHENNVYHRDIKLDNILLDRTGNIKLIDFGFSILAEKSQRLKTHCGTLSYMAPEIVTKKEYYGGPVDMWALGVILYSMLFGRYPFSGSTDPELIKKIKEASIKFPDEISTPTQRIIKGLLEVNPNKRLTSQELLLSLNNPT